MSNAASNDGWPTFVSLGMVVIDELRFPNRKSMIDVPGGSGLYATLGARLIHSANKSSPTSIGCIVLAGHDFPKTVLQEIQGWQLDIVIREMHDHPATRGLLEYEDDAFGEKSFVYTAPPLQPRPSDLEASNLFGSKSFHLLASPESLKAHVSALLDLRKQHHGIKDRPLIVWEPAPLGCNSINLQEHIQACKLVDVFSPNHLELGYLVQGRDAKNSCLDKAAIEKLASKFLESGIGPGGNGLAVIRSGELGVLILSAAGPQWLPAFYEGRSRKVVDPTGAGNAFLGGFTVSFCESGDPREASICGTVAASFALEQFGPANLSVGSQGSEELWNGVSVAARTREFRTRLSSHEVPIER